MQGGRSRCPFLVLLLAAAVALPFLATAQPWPLCDQRSGNYSSGSAYEDNISRLISDLHAKATSSPSFFAADFAGTGAGTVYGLMLCRGDVSASDCFDCGTFAGRDLQRVCNRTRDVALCYNQCYVRISDTDFLANATNSGLVKLIGGTTISSGVDVAAYDRAVTALLNATARHAAENNSTTRKSSPRGSWLGSTRRSRRSGRRRSARRTCIRSSVGAASTTWLRSGSVSSRRTRRARGWSALGAT